MLTEEQIYAHYRGKSLLLDSNLLLVLLVGSLGRSVFTNFKRVNHFSYSDYEFLVDFTAEFTRLLTTPHILTEVNGLANQLPNWIKPEWSARFAEFLLLGSNSALVERSIAAHELALMPEFSQYGLTDSAVSKLAEDTLVVTEDYRLSGALRSRQLPVLNFRDLLVVRNYVS